MTSSASYEKRAAMASSSSSFFPLPVHFFPRLKLSIETWRSLEERADANVHQAIQHADWDCMHEYEAHGWKLASGKRDFRETGVRTYSRKARARRKLEFKCVGHVPMALDDLMDAFYADNTIEYRAKLSVLLESSFIDAAVLHVHQHQTPEQPFRYVGMNWIATNNPGFLRKKRDLCCLRSTGIAYDDQKCRIGFVSLDSMALKECRPLEKSHGLVRTQLSAVLLLRESVDTKRTNLLWVGNVDLTSGSSSALLALVHHAFTSCVRGLNMLLDVKSIARQTDVERSEWVPNAHRKFCFLCTKRFTLLRSRHHCRSCGEVMCKDCEVVRPSFRSDQRDSLLVPSLDNLTERKRYCKKCVGAARHQLEAAQRKELPLGLNESTSSNAELVIVQSILSESLTMDYSMDRLSSLNSPDGSRRCWSETSHASSSAISIRCPPSVRSTFTGGSRSMRRRRLLQSSTGSISAPSHDTTMDEGMERESDLATRLWEISCKAQEALETTKRNSCMMSDSGGSTVRLSTENLAFHNLDRSIAEQADLLNVIGLVSTGRVYMEHGGDDSGGSVNGGGGGGVRMSLSKTERFEMID